MSINNVSIENGYYGTYTLDKNKKRIFTKVGKAITIDDIHRNLDENIFTLLLSFDYLGNTQTVSVSRDVYTEPKLISTLSSAGADISKKTYDTAIDSLRLQEQWLEASGFYPTAEFKNLGWLKLQIGQSVKACFRSHKLIGDVGTYVGNYKIIPMGSFDEWRKMVLEDVIGDTVAELVLLASLSSVIVTIVAPVNSPGNPIMHIYGMSGCGKSTLLELCTSAAGEPFEGDKIINDASGSPKVQRSLYRSWGGTINALNTSCSGNRGYPVILNELGKCSVADLTTLVYNFSEGTDKLRCSKDMQAMQSEGYATSFISAGEHSLLDRCKDKSDGLRVRVLELEMIKTPDGADRADRIKRVCKKNNGHAIPMMAKYIIDNKSYKEVQQLYVKNYEECVKNWTQHEGYERFISKFVAIYLTTADIASKALDIPFNKEAIRNFLRDYDSKNGSQRNSSLSSYDVLLEEFAKNRHKFIDKEGNVPKNECWGKIEYCNRKIDKNKTLVERILVFRSQVEHLLKENGFKNFDTCYRAWKNADLIDYEKDKNTRKRKIYPLSDKKHPVFVFNVYDDTTVPESKVIYNNTKNLLNEEEEKNDIANTTGNC